MTVHNDTVENAVDTPDLEQPYEELGLQDDEYAKICLLYTSDAADDAPRV